jgi:hypothetical protein
MKNDVDAVELVRSIRDNLYEATEEMSAAELVEFFWRRAEPSREKLARIERHHEVAAAPNR